MAETVLFQTNDPALLSAADASFGRFPLLETGRDPLIIRLFTETAPGRPATDRAPATDPEPAADPEPASGREGVTGRESEQDRVRMGAGSLVHRTDGGLFLIVGPRDVAAVDVESGVGVGWVSAATADDTDGVRYSFI